MVCWGEVRVGVVRRRKKKVGGYNGKIGDEKQGCKDEMKPFKNELARYLTIQIEVEEWREN